MATTLVHPTFKDIQWLADRPRGEGMVVSCYADLTVASAVRPLWREQLKNEIKRLDEAIGDDAAARVAFQRNIAAIEALLAHRVTSRGARGIGIFAAVQRNLVQGFTLNAAVPDRLVVDEEPYLVPVLELFNRQRRYLVVHTDSHHARLYAADPGAVSVIEMVSANVPKHHRACGEMWGKQQATIARHRENVIAHYLTELANEVERAWRDQPYNGIVLLGERDVLESFRAELPDYIARRIVGEARHAWAGRQLSLESKIDAIRAGALETEDRAVIAEVTARLSEAHRIAAGPQEAINAIRNSQVGFPGRLVMEPDRGAVAWHCSGCTSLFAHTVEQCPFCHASCDRTNLWQAIALLAMRHNIPLHVLPAGSGLEPYGGVVALLSRADAWGTAPHATLAAALPE